MTPFRFNKVTGNWDFCQPMLIAHSKATNHYMFPSRESCHCPKYYYYYYCYYYYYYYYYSVFNDWCSFPVRLWRSDGVLRSTRSPLDPGRSCIDRIRMCSCRISGHLHSRFGIHSVDRNFDCGKHVNPWSSLRRRTIHAVAVQYCCRISGRYTVVTSSDYDWIL